MQRDFISRRRRLGVIPFHICRAVVHHLFAKKFVFLLLALAKRGRLAQQLFRLRVRRNLALIHIIAIGDFKLYVHALVRRGYRGHKRLLGRQQIIRVHRRMGKLRQAQTRRQRVNKWFHRDSFLYFPFAGIVCRIRQPENKNGRIIACFALRRIRLSAQ